jgi:glycosyltransferase involved in cell wall biosynthesis
LSQRAFSSDPAAAGGPADSDAAAADPGNAAGPKHCDDQRTSQRGVFLTAGAAGMYCGSCMHDNAMARALRQQGVDCLLQPVYTPIRADGVSVANERLFFGGIHVYLLQQLPWIRWIPAALRRSLDWPPLIRWATSRADSTDAAKLGELAISMLQGIDGRQRDEVFRLVDWLADDLQADAVVLSNLLIGGVLPEIRRRLPHARLIVILQGDDIFLDHLPAAARQKCVELCRGLIRSVDRLVVNSRFYAEKMGAVFDVPPDKFEVIPLSIDTRPFSTEPMRPVTAATKSAADEFRLGYLARIAPEKGFHHIVEAFVALASQPEHQNLTLHAAGWLGESNRGYLDSQLQVIESAGLAGRFTYHGSPDLDRKVEFLGSLDLFSVPTEYQEPKGLFVLEALASGVPVVQPNHGAFGELLAATGGGMIVPPGDTAALVEAIGHLKENPDKRRELADQGRENVIANHSSELAAERMRALMFDA